MTRTAEAHFLGHIEGTAAREPERTAIRFLDGNGRIVDQVTFADLILRSSAIAGELVKREMRARPVLLAMSPGIEFVVALLGCLRAGALAVPVPLPVRAEHWSRIERIAADCGAHFGVVTLSSPVMQSQIGCSVNWVSVAELEAGAPAPLPLDWVDDEVAYLQYTSGSTARPKGVCVSKRSLARNIGYFIEAFVMTRDDVVVTWLPHFHDMGLVGTLLAPLYLGASIVLMSPLDFVHAPIRWLRAIAQFRGTVVGAPNFAYELCAQRIDESQARSLDLSCLRVAFNGAETVQAATMQRFSARFASCGLDPTALCPSYGLAEATLIVAAKRPGLPISCKQVDRDALSRGLVRPVAQEGGGSRILVGVGSPIPAGSVAIVDPTTARRAAVGHVGEIWIRSGSVASGYFGNVVESRASFGAQINGESGETYLRTGDLGFMDADELFIAGRLKDLVLVRGQNFHPHDIEHTLERLHPGFRSNRAAAFSIEREGSEGFVLLQELRTRPDASTADQMLTAIREAVTREHGVAPDAVLLVPRHTLTFTSSGKLARWACREAFLERRIPVLAAWYPPNESLEALNVCVPEKSDVSRRERIARWLTSAVARYARLADGDIGRDEPYARFGLDSLRSVEIAAQLGRALNEAISPALLLDYPSVSQTVEALCPAMRSAERASKRSRPRARERSEPIAIVGMSCRFPGAEDLDAFWNLLEKGLEGLTPVAAARGFAAEVLAAIPPLGGFIGDLAQFDAELFGLAPKTAAALDPQQRLLLEESWRALEHAGYSPTALAGSATGVFVGASHSDHLLAMLGPQAPAPDSSSGLSGALSLIANRVSYCLDLKGPSLTVDTACSSSLAAIHLARTSLLRHECDLALAAGVNLILAPALTQSFMKAGMLSSDGRCRTFDVAASGYVRSEGVGVVVLRRLRDARSSGDRILALLRGSAVRQDGRTVGITAPNGPAQTAVIREALATAGIPASRVSYVEAHGTGTPVGDLVEVKALAAALGPRAADRRFMMGSVKTNVGHLEAAAGMAGLMKTVLAIQHRAIPAHLNLVSLNPQLPLDCAHIPTRLTPWNVVSSTSDAGDQRSDGSQQPTGSRRVAGVSSFGIGGTLAHAILQEPREIRGSMPTMPERPLHVLCLSADGTETVRAHAARLAQAFSTRSESELADLCYSANVGRAHLRRRAAQVVQSMADARNFLHGVSHGAIEAARSNGGSADVALLLTGQGARVGRTYRGFFETQPEFRAAMRRCDAAFRPHLGASLLEHLYGVRSCRDDAAYLIQPTLFAIDYSLAKMWEGWGISPAAYLGHSLGEWVAVTLAEMLSLEDAARIVTARGRLMADLPRDGGMIAVRAAEAELADIVAAASDTLAIAAINGPRNVVLSGHVHALAQARDELTQLSIAWQPLPVMHAFHSPLMLPIVEPFREALRDVTWMPAKVPVISNVTGEPLADCEATADYWVRHALGTVQFLRGYRFLRAQGLRLFLEAGPDAVLSRFGRAIEQGSTEAVLVATAESSAENESTEQWRDALSTLACLYCQGVEVNWLRFDSQRGRRKIPLPAYPFRRVRLPATNAVSQAGPSQHALHRVQWIPEPLPSGGVLRSGETWLIRHEGRIGAALTERMRKAGYRCIEVEGPPAGPYSPRVGSARESGEKIDGIVHLLGCGPPSDRHSALCLVAELRKTVHDVVSLTRAVLATGVRARLKLLLVSSYGQLIDDVSSRPLVSARAGLAAIGNALSQEEARLCAASVDVEAEHQTTEALAERLLGEIGALESGSAGRCVAWVGTERVIPRLVPVQDRAASQSSSLAACPGATYLITGGQTGIGLEVARALASERSVHLILLNRTAPEPGSARERALAGLRTGGCRVEAVAADVTDRTALERLITSLVSRGCRLRGVVHCAGILDEGRLLDMDESRLDAVIHPKLLGASLLDELTRSFALDFFVVCSSLASVAGLSGQGAYAAANACLDAFAAERARTGGAGRSLAIEWPPWRDTGMVAQPEYRRGLAARGVSLLPDAEGIAGLAAALMRTEPRLALFRPGDVQIGRSAVTRVSSEELLSRAAADVDHLQSLVRSAGYASFRSDCQRLASHFAALALNAADLKIHPKHRCYAACLKAYEPAAEKLQPGSVDTILATHPSYAGMLTLLTHVGSALPDVLSGRLTGQEVLFPGGTADMLNVAYSEDADASALQAVVARLVDEEAATCGRALNIIEIGAGTGSTLRRVHQRLCGRPFQYTASDVSRFFVNRLAATAPVDLALTACVLDIAKSPEEQGIDSHTFDVLIATSVLHATPDLRRTLAHVRSLLAPKGLLVLAELTRRHLALDLIFGVMQEWWSFSDVDVRSDSPLLSADAWCRLLMEAGFVDIRCVPHDLQDAAQAVIVARVPSTVTGVTAARNIALAKQAPAISARTSEADSAPTVARAVNAVLASTLGFPPGGIDRARTFVELGLDSLMAVEAASALTRALDMRVSPIALFEHPTAAQLIEHLAAEQLRRGAAPVDATQPPLRAREAVAERAVAIIGLACRFPGASDERSFWQLLSEGRDAITEVPAERWSTHDSPELTAARWGGFLAGIDAFDPLFFDISPREARVMDPQQRLLLETAWTALESAGYAGAAVHLKRTGVFIGCSQNGYLQRISPHLTPSDTAAGIGNQNAIIPNRLSYFLNLRGPSVLVDTLCSSSLTAIHMACRSLRQGECDMALAGGVNLLLSAEYYRGLVRLNALARDGRCKAFDASADGFVSGEGVGIILLKRLDRALADRDTIRGIIRGSAINHDGRTNGLTAPSPAAQFELLRAAWEDADVTASELTYIEAHGTGTQLGDPIEIEGLARAFRADPMSAKCALGSVKTNIGHLEPAAGVASLIKVVLAMEHRALPPTLHFKQPNPQIPFAQTPFSVNTRLTSWQSDGVRRAGVSSFGMGGANVHVVLQEAPVIESDHPEAVSGPFWLQLSARSPSALATMLEQLADFLSTNSGSSLSDVAYTLAVGRASFSHRAAVLTADLVATCARLRRAAVLAREGEGGTSEILLGSAVSGVSHNEASLAPPSAASFVAGGELYVDANLAARARRVLLPTYPFERRRCWVDGERSANPLLGRRVG